MRIIGALLLAVACTLFGLGQARRLYFHKSCLEGFLDALRYMDAELKNSSEPVPDIFGELKSRGDWKLCEFFRKLCLRMENFGEESLADIWSGCVMEEESVRLTPSERRELCRVGAYLGKFSEDDQSEAIQACVSHLNDALRELSEGAREKAKLYTGLGITAGLMLATVLI